MPLFRDFVKESRKRLFMASHHGVKAAYSICASSLELDPGTTQTAHEPRMGQHRPQLSMPPHYCPVSFPTVCTVLATISTDCRSIPFLILIRTHRHLMREGQCRI